MIRNPPRRSSVRHTAGIVLGIIAGVMPVPVTVELGLARRARLRDLGRILGSGLRRNPWSLSPRPFVCLNKNSHRSKEKNWICWKWTCIEICCRVRRKKEWRRIAHRWRIRFSSMSSGRDRRFKRSRIKIALIRILMGLRSRGIVRTRDRLMWCKLPLRRQWMRRYRLSKKWVSLFKRKRVSM